MPTVAIPLVPVGDRPLVGGVAEFDEARGLGVVEYGRSSHLTFHCTAITDGTRRIAPGTVVAFVIGPGRRGQLEARSVRPLPGVVPPGSTLGDGVPTGETDGEPAAPVSFRAVSEPVAEMSTPPSGTAPVIGQG